MLLGYITQTQNSPNRGISQKLIDENDFCGFHFNHSFSLSNHISNHNSKNLVLKSTNQPILQDKDTGCVLSGWVRLDNRFEIAESLGEPIQDVLVHSEQDIHLLLKSYIHWGEDFLQRLVGDFTFFIWDPRTQDCLLVRDQMGIRPLYLYANEDKLCFASSIALLKEALGKELSLSKNWLGQFPIYTSEDFIKTAYNEVRKLPPAHFARFQEGRLITERYFRFDTQKEISFDNQEDYFSSYLSLLKRAVQCRLPQSNSAHGHPAPIGIELSGGLDSSSILAIAKKYFLSTNQIKTYSSLIFEQDKDCIELVIQHLNLNEPIVTEAKETDLDKTLENLEEMEEIYGMPLEQAISSTHSNFYRHAQKTGCKTLLSGFGGDEFVTSQAGYVTHEYWQQQNYRKWFQSFQGMLIIRLARAFKWLLQNRFSKKYNKEYREKRSFNQFLVESWDAKMTTRLESCSIAAAKYGLEYSWPLLDIRLIQFYLSVPNEQKRGLNTNAGIGRYLHRQTLNELLPMYIVWKNKDMGAPISKKPYALLKQYLDNQTREFADLNKDLQKSISSTTFQCLLKKTSSTENKSLEWYKSASQLQRIYQLNNWLSKRNN